VEELSRALTGARSLFDFPGSMAIRDRGTPAMATSPFLWNWVAKGYAKSPVPDEAAYQKKLAVTRTYFRPDMEVMEFGCGTGTTAVAHAPFVKQVHAYDVSDKMLDIARSRAKEAGVTNATFERADIIDLDLPPSRFDVVMAHSILHLLKPRHRDAVLAKVLRVLKPNGVFVSSTVCIGEFKGLVRIIPPIMRALPFMPPVQGLTRQELRNAVTGAGLTVEHEWAPNEKAALFLVARKTAGAAPQAMSIE
jgi:SAM-dependent methyltransferase